MGAYSPPEISQQSLCVYAMLRPKSMLKPLAKILTSCMDSLSSGEQVHPNLLSSYQVEIGRSGYTESGSKEPLRQIDVDSKDPSFLVEFKKVLQETKVSETIVCIVETKNGFHIVFRKSANSDMKRLHEYRLSTSAADDKSQKKNLEQTCSFTMTNEPLVIVPGTYQGGFKARLCPLEEFFA